MGGVSNTHSQAVIGGEAVAIVTCRGSLPTALLSHQDDHAADHAIASFLRELAESRGQETALPPCGAEGNQARVTQRAEVTEQGEGEESCSQGHMKSS